MHTADIDFIFEETEDMWKISDAKADANQNETQHYPPNWINAEIMVFFLNHTGCEALFGDSVNQGIVLFRSEALVVFAADLRFQLLNKIDRTHWLLTSERSYQKELSDALAIPHVILTQREMAPITKTELTTWHHYGRLLKSEAIAFRDDAYQREYGHVTIIEWPK